MIWLPVTAAFAFGAGLALLAVWFLQSRNLPGPGVHTGPMLVADEPPAHPRYGKLLDTPADGVGVVFPEGTLYVGAHERFIPRKQTDDHSPWATQSFPAVDAGQSRTDYIREQLARRKPEEITLEFLGELMQQTSRVPGFGVDKCEADVLEAERLARVMQP